MCVSRLKLLKQLNPHTPIFAVYGGPLECYASWNARIAPLVDDSWCFTQPRDLEWKWRNGDQILSNWFQERGAELSWDSVMIVQWDLLILAPIETLFKGLGPEDVYLPGLIPVAEVEQEWCWVRPDHWEAEIYQAFRDHMAKALGYNGPWLACQFITAVFPRRFLERYSTIPEPEIGFLEYKLPSCAVALGFRPTEVSTIDVAWPVGPRRQRRPACSAERWEVGALTIAWNWSRPDGQRLFHPFYRPFPCHRWAMVGFLLVDSLVTELGGRLQRAWRKRVSG